jgi:hypothetical protein
LCLCIAACVGFAALFVRSYTCHDSMISPRGQYHVELWKGQITCHWSTPEPEVDDRWGWHAADAEQYQKLLDLMKPFSYPTFLGFGWLVRATHWHILFPHWFAVFLAGATAILLKRNPRWQISLRELFIVATIAAVVLGAMAALAPHPM